MVIDSQPEYEIKNIVGTCKHRGKREYLIKWKGYGDHENSWEPATHLTHAKDLISEYNSQQITTISIYTITSQLDWSLDNQPTIKLHLLISGDEFKEFHYQSQSQISNSNNNMNAQTFDTTIKKAILRCTQIKEGKIYWLIADIPTGLHDKTCLCHYCTNINKRNRRCYKCNNKNHIYADCPHIKSSTYNTKKHCNWNKISNYSPDWEEYKIPKEKRGWGNDNPN